MKTYLMSDQMCYLEGYSKPIIRSMMYSPVSVIYSERVSPGILNCRPVLPEVFGRSLVAKSAQGMLMLQYVQPLYNKKRHRYA